MFIDTHCHLDFPEFDPDRDAVIERAKAGGVRLMINIGSSLEGSRRSLELARLYGCVFATVGIHPHEADAFDNELMKTLSHLARESKVVALGEAGLDFFKNYSKPENQRVLFRQMIGLAKETSLPLVVHTRQAEGETLSLLKEQMPLKAVVHCFSGDEKFLKECLELGFLVSFTCNITYKKARGLKELVRAVPLEKLMLETDAPFLPPEGFRGKRNEPLFVKMLAEEIARIKQVDVNEVARATTENAKRFFNIA